MANEHHRVRLTEQAKDDLRRIKKKYGKKTYEVLRDLILDLEFEPEKKGEPLAGQLSGLYSRHHSRFRIIYQIDREQFLVIVVGGGWHETNSRNDIYFLLERAIKRGSIIIQSEPSKDATEESAD